MAYMSSVFTVLHVQDSWTEFSRGDCESNVHTPAPSGNGPNSCHVAIWWRPLLSCTELLSRHYCRFLEDHWGPYHVALSSFKPAMKNLLPKPFLYLKSLQGKTQSLLRAHFIGSDSPKIISFLKITWFGTLIPSFTAVPRQAPALGLSNWEKTACSRW